MRRLRKGVTVTLLVLMALGGAIYWADQNLDSDDDDDPELVVEGETPQTPEPSGEGVTIKTVSDGDSFVANLGSSGSVEVRMIGINAPEFGECLHHEARSTLTEMLRAGDVTLQGDVTNTDQYGRLLRYVMAGGLFLNQEMVDRGLALSISTRPDTTRQADLEAAQARARGAGSGIWNPHACGPAASTAVHIVQVQADPRGRDQHNLNGEFAVIANSGDTPVDMTGWKLRDDSTRNRFWFPEDFVLGAGRSVTVHVGGGEDTEDALYWGRRYPVWDNERDTALLLDPSSNVVSVLDVRPA